MSSRITTDLAVDPALVMNAAYRFDPADRRYIDDQIRGIEQHLVDSLIAGRHGSWFNLDGASDSVVVGDTVCLASGQGTVTKSTAVALASAKAGAGVAIQAASPGGKVFVAFGGILSPSITGLGTLSGFARIDPSTGRLETTSVLAASDIGMGAVDGSGYLSLGGGGVTTDLTGTLATSDDTPTIIRTYSIADGECLAIRAIVKVAADDTPTFAEFEVKAGYSRNGGTITEQHNTVTTVYGTASVAITNVDPGSITVTVTGIAATPMTWRIAETVI